MPHIVLDTRTIETSTGRYMQRLLENINDKYAGDVSSTTFSALVPSSAVEKWQKRLPNISIIAADQKWYSFSEQWSLYWQLHGLKPDLVHFTMPQQPLLWTGPAVTTVHDMTLVRFDNIAPGESKSIYRVKQKVFHGLLRVVVRRSKAIITPTNFVKNDLADFFGDKYSSNIHVTPLAGEIPDVYPTEMPEYRDADFLLVIGNGFPYKNVWRVIQAHQKLLSSNPKLTLLIAGKKDEFYQDLEKQCEEENYQNVHFLGFISDGEKRWALQNAVCYVTASYSEGFCMPILEAMQEGCPVVASNASCLPEVVGKAGLLFNPDSTDDLVATLQPLLAQESERAALIRKGHKHAAQFSWEKMVNQVYDIYQSALDRSTSSSER